MKIKCIIAAILILIVCFVSFGCTSKVENEDISITIDDFQKQGKYTGEIDDDVPNGKGKFKTANSQNEPYVLDGEWEDGKMVKGSITFTSSSQSVRYECESYENNMPKKGKMYVSGELIYEGEFTDNMPTGQGKLYKNGHVVYEGYVEIGMPMLETVNINQDVKFTDWTYRVTKVETQKVVGDISANDIFVVVHIDVVNNAKVPRKINLNKFFFLFDSEGREYDLQERVMSQNKLLDINTDWYLNEIQPGSVAQDIKLVFDVSTDAENLKLLPREGAGKTNPVLVLDKIQ